MIGFYGLFICAWLGTASIADPPHAPVGVVLSTDEFRPRRPTRKCKPRGHAGERDLVGERLGLGRVYY